MINAKAFQNCVTGLVGFRNSLDKDIPRLSIDLLASSSGVIINDQHALITMDNVYNCIVNTGIISLPDDWSSGTNYATDDQVQSAGIIYTALQNSTNQPVSDEDYWQNEGNPLSMYIREKMIQSATQLANKVYLLKNLNQSAKSILPDVMLYKREGNIRKSIEKQGRFVGFRIRFKDSGISGIIRRIGLQFDEPQTGLGIYLYNSSQVDPVKIWQVNTASGISFQWAALSEQIISYLTSETNAASDYYIGYYEDDITGKAINNQYPFGDFGCGPCDSVNYSLRQQWGQYIDLAPISVLPSDLQSGRQLWDVEQNQYSWDNNFGLNFTITINCDTTDFFCRNKIGLANAIALQTAVSIIEDMAYSARDNQKMLKLQQMANFALDNRDGNPGLRTQLNDAMQAVNFNYAGASKTCLPCEDLYNNSISISSVY